jgi:hypothetical protein
MGKREWSMVNCCPGKDFLNWHNHTEIDFCRIITLIQWLNASSTFFLEKKGRQKFKRNQCVTVCFYQIPSDDCAREPTEK